jgi:predicted Zn-dependent peptidase
VGLDWSHCRTYRSVGDNLRIVEQITLDDVHRVLETWPLDAPAAAVVAGPGSGG